ncbi:MAG: indole-3-glycerol phosphate synthase TrpC [Gammaproteobacteria bacterium]|nr:indole-3-glycerol phosphate synthase TrpC [Gammaproteobacteria bacterium]
MSETPDILQEIVNSKLEEVKQRSSLVGLERIKLAAGKADAARGFTQALLAKKEQGESAVIAEIKKASPSKGIICKDFNPGRFAKGYAKGGAACLSVLTDEKYFKGDIFSLVMARKECDLPVLRKDFIIDEYQIYESRAMAADCILLIVAILDDQQLSSFHEIAQSLGMDVLVEVHNEEEMARALKLDLKMVGINNRNLKTFETSLYTTLALQNMVPDGCLLVTESGILSKEDVRFMRDHEVNAFLVGEAFMREKSPGVALKELFFS